MQAQVPWGRSAKSRPFAVRICGPVQSPFVPRTDMEGCSRHGGRNSQLHFQVCLDQVVRCLHTETVISSILVSVSDCIGASSKGMPRLIAFEPSARRWFFVHVTIGVAGNQGSLGPVSTRVLVIDFILELAVFRCESRQLEGYFSLFQSARLCAKEAGLAP